MRAQPFLAFLAQNYNPANATTLASVAGINGGWEVWLQVEIALCFQAFSAGTTCTREQRYPSAIPGNPYLTYDRLTGVVGNTNIARDACRCDFYLNRNTPTVQDGTYLELKCIDPNAATPLNSAWNNFGTDFAKACALNAANPLLECMVLLATFGTFSANDVGGLNPALAGLWANNHSAYVWDPTNNAVTTLQTVLTGGNPRFFLLAVAI